MTNTPGRPGTFQKGEDPRRHKGGAKTKEAQSFAVLFANALASGGDPKALASVLWDKAMKGQPWAVEMIMDRLLGKVTQPTDNAHEVIYRVIYDKAAGVKG